MIWGLLWLFLIIVLWCVGSKLQFTPCGVKSQFGEEIPIQKGAQLGLKVCWGLSWLRLVIHHPNHENAGKTLMIHGMELLLANSCYAYSLGCVFYGVIVCINDWPNAMNVMESGCRFSLVQGNGALRFPLLVYSVMNRIWSIYNMNHVALEDNIESFHVICFAIPCICIAIISHFEFQIYVLPSLHVFFYLVSRHSHKHLAGISFLWHNTFLFNVAPGTHFPPFSNSLPYSATMADQLTSLSLFFLYLNFPSKWRIYMVLLLLIWRW